MFSDGINNTDTTCVPVQLWVFNNFLTIVKSRSIWAIAIAIMSLSDVKCLTPAVQNTDSSIVCMIAMQQPLQ